jgi:SAM-dependent methyltransferase
LAVSSPLLTLQARIRFDGGSCRELDIDRWLAEADDVDHRLLDRARGPVIDIGCGPGRHVEALTMRSTEALGIDLSPDFVAFAQARDRRVLLRSVFDPLPREAAWRSALLLDGSIGIGGDPAALLRRVGDLLASGGRALVETAGPEGRSDRVTMSLESHDGADSWFDWATLAASDVGPLTRSTTFELADQWQDGDRWFAQLDRR